MAEKIASSSDISNGVTDSLLLSSDVNGVECGQLNGHILPPGKCDDVSLSGDRGKHGLSFYMASFFMMAQMAGAGFLALPRAMANTGSVGLFLMIVFCISVGFSATRLGRCWVILEERWMEYRHTVRQPYMEIGYRAYGIWGRRLVLTCMMTALVGTTIVFMNLLAEFMNDFFIHLSTCQWVLIIAFCLMPFTWLGTPKDFWQASVLAVVSTVVAVIVIVVKAVFDHLRNPTAPPATYPNPSFSSFFLGFGAILFAFGGSSVFPTVQNDMRDRRLFSKSVLLCFIAIITLYLPVGIVGYYIYGDSVHDNIFLSLKPSAPVTVAIALQIVNLLGTFVISFNPVAQCIEDVIAIPKTFGWQRISVRSSIILFEVMVSLAVPDFGLVLNLIGGSAITCLSFVLPPILYMKLVDSYTNKEWPERKIPKWERVYLIMIVLVGVLGGASSTFSAMKNILSPEAFGKSCFVAFFPANTSSTTFEASLYNNTFVLDGQR